jgi:hypothetical protein
MVEDLARFLTMIVVCRDAGLKTPDGKTMPFGFGYFSILAHMSTECRCRDPASVTGSLVVGRSVAGNGSG